MRLNEYVANNDWQKRPELDLIINDTKTTRRIKLFKDKGVFVCNLYRVISDREMFSYSQQNKKIEKLIEDFSDWRVVI